MRTLYHTPLSPFCRKIRLMLLVKKLPFVLKNENIWDPSEEFYDLNPAGEIPVLVEEDGQIICGNHPIMEYLEEQYPEIPLLGATREERIEIRRLVDWFDGKFDREVTQNLLFEKVYKRMSRCGGPDTEALRLGRQNINPHMEYIIYLSDNRRWLAGDALTLADLAAGAHISALDYLGDVPWLLYPKAKQWYSVLKSRPAFQNVLTDRIAGITPPPYYDNPDF